MTNAIAMTQPKSWLSTYLILHRHNTHHMKTPLQEDR